VSAGPVMPVAKNQLALHPVAGGPLTGGTAEITGGFWGDRQRQNREVTIPHGIRMLEESGTLENLRIAAGMSSGEYHLPVFRDSDLYKLLEAVAWERAHGADRDLEAFFSSSAGLLEAAQDPDGYVNSYVQVVEKGHRFGDPAMGHELYCAGHLFQAAVADARTASGPPSSDGHSLWPVAGRFASMLLDVLRVEQAKSVEGHPEVETALAELYRTGGDKRYLELSEDLLARRGHNTLRWRSFGPSYFQDDVPFEQARSVRGHAVRCLYLLAGATDLYTENGNQALLTSALSQWDDMASAKTYLTGGVGSRHKDEAFGVAFELPPDRAYCETCAAIASIMWNWRLLLLTGEARFAELMERTLYNGFLAGVGLDGTSFFYVNPLQARQVMSRSPWYYCACCPPNVMRLLASLEHYLATATEDGIQVHQYASGRVRSELGPGGAFELAVRTDYPFGGTVALRAVAVPSGPSEVAVRIPSWAGEAPGTLNGKPAGSGPGPDGYYRLRREWSVGDELVIELSMRPRVVGASGALDAVRGCVAFERGPLVYCVESRDLGKQASLPRVSVVRGTTPGDAPGLVISGQTMVALKFQGLVTANSENEKWPYYDQSGRTRGAGQGENLNRDGPAHVELRAVPYFAWANRGPAEMRVWVPESS
jgi:uncharacterized protein